MKSSNIKKRIKVIAVTFLGLICLLCALLFSIFFHEIRTLLSIHKINDAPVYQIDYHGDYALDKYLQTGAKDWNDLINFINKNLGKGIGNYLYSNSGCSTFFARTPEGDYLLARNLDTLQATPAIITTNSKHGYQAIGIANLETVGWRDESPVTKLTSISCPYFTFDGMNEYGLAIASLSVPVGKTTTDDTKTTIHDITVNRAVIDKAKNINEAIELLSRYNIKMEVRYPSHYMIADAEGNSIIVEYIQGEMKLVDRKGNYQIATNFIQYENETMTGYSSDRYHSFDQELSRTNGIISIEAALDLLEDNVIPGEAQWSVVYNLTKRTMTVEFSGDSYKNTYCFDLTK